MGHVLTGLGVHDFFLLAQEGQKQADVSCDFVKSYFWVTCNITMTCCNLVHMADHVWNVIASFITGCNHVFVVLAKFLTGLRLWYEISVVILLMICITKYDTME